MTKPVETGKALEPQAHARTKWIGYSCRCPGRVFGRGKDCGAQSRLIMVVSSCRSARDGFLAMARSIASRRRAASRRARYRPRKVLIACSQRKYELVYVRYNAGSGLALPDPGVTCASA